MAINEKYSFKDFMGQSFKDKKAEEFNNTTIKGSCFYQEWKEGDKDVVKDIFPDGMTGVVFEKCNLDNVLVPAGNTVEGGTHKKIKVQNDRQAWKLDKENKPIEPMNKRYWEDAGMSVDPKDIPITKITEEEFKMFEKTLSDSISLEVN